MAERKWVLSKLAAGDYMFASNDALTLWRIQRYVDGPSFGLMDWPRDRDLWRVRRWTGDFSTGEITREDAEDWSQWEPVEDGFDTRREAIDYALELG